MAAQNFVSGNISLAAAIYKESAQCTDGNFSSAPFLIAANLTVMCWGTKDDTAYEIKDAIKIPNNQSEAMKLIKDIMKKLKDDKFFFLRIANRIYLHDSFALRKDFSKLIDHTDINIEHVNFANTDAMVEKANKWLEKQTDGKITKFCCNTDINADFWMILISGLCFRGFWLKSHQRDGLIKKTFYLNNDEEIEADFMEKTGVYNYYEDKDLKVKMLQFNLENKDLKVVFVLPDEKYGLSQVENQVENIFNHISFGEVKIQVNLPKFKVKSKLNRLKRTLQHLGIKLLFKEEADFGGLLPEQNVLFVNEVYQNVLVEFCEEESKGPKAIRVAKTGKTVATEDKQFIADHPFLFYITLKDVIIVTGRVVNPEQL